MNTKLLKTIAQLLPLNISAERKIALHALAEFIQKKKDEKAMVNINFICTHNSRRSHLAQIWAQTAANYYNVLNVNCFSGGTEVTALFPKIAETLEKQGFEIAQISEGNNPIYAIKFAKNTASIIGFSKKYDHTFNPTNGFAAVMTCSQADNGCPFIAGAEKRISIPYEDPKISDNTSEQDEIYTQRSLEIAIEMFYVFSTIKS